MKSFLKNTVLLAALFAAGFMAQAQIVTPDLSPFATLSQKIGFSEVHVEYSRPSVRGRIVFGELVPYDKVWRLGANASTKLYIKEGITIQDSYKLTPGIYALYAIPGKEEWTMIISRDPWLWGAFDYTDKYDVVRFKVKPQPLKEPVETFTIQFANVCPNCAELQFFWDYTKVGFRITTSVDEKVVAEIKKFTNNPEAKIAGEYYIAAKYYLDTNRELAQALTWIEKALEYSPEAYWMMHTKAEIQAKMGDFKGAIETATLSKDYAKAKNDQDYVRMNEMEIERWKELRKNKSE
ncbi:MULTISPECIES: DUF2911 domain-containing protein [unclassified Imperialibacter]|uniref:DUF2911 domain-containing protein n=1 Tax=unclassified Imperialibacter TaxID=2629706 RepID=UPI0012518457|nr:MULTISPECIES: DUF2911 domain-containing protein [unclassified Imperialibacter]CAD5265435.1 conserved exported hypothetical protein [Imperialibacter sp. 89]CAD5270287.1 conserved exported hypothetical protein [Imperialibacter sp. 75]VVT09912.1 conserved exported hypothetical protein [Imperialibacter sp. EC-SDR9]